MRDNADGFRAAECVLLGASFDTPAENLAFAEAQGFEYLLLSDTDHRVGIEYGVVRGAGDQYALFPRRYSYLIDPTGIIRRSYVVADVAAHASSVLADLQQLRNDSQ